MNNGKNVTQFEFLPNEFLIQCFEYLNACDLFHSFHQLNNRFNNLIRHIRLYINLEDVNKTIFDGFYTKMLLNPQMKNQVYSLYFPFDNECFQTRTFLSLFSHEEFPNLQSYGLILPSISPLSSSSSSSGPNVNLIIEPIDTLLPKLRTFSITQIHRFGCHFANINSSITNLTVDQCDLEYFCRLLKYLPQLKYFHIQRIHYTNPEYENGEEFSKTELNSCLKQLIIDDFRDRFKKFEIYAKHLPHLKSLTISNLDNVEFLDAHRWEQLITSYLPSLNIFKFIFKFIVYCSHKNEKKFKQFQSDFWQKHQWFTEYIIANSLSFIYTIPYPSNTFKLPFESKRSYNHSIQNNINTFTNVKNLLLYQETPITTSEYYFPNITSLTLISFYLQPLRLKHIEYFKNVFNLFHLKHLDITGMGHFNNISILLKIFKQTPQLFSLAIRDNEFTLLFNNEQLSNYLNKMIKRLYIHRNHDNFQCPIEQFSNIFGNIEHLQYEIGYGKRLIFLLSHFPKLSTLHLKWTNKDNVEKYLFQLKNEIRKLNLIYDINIESTYSRYSSYYDYRTTTSMNMDIQMWLGKNTAELLTNFMNVMNTL